MGEMGFKGSGLFTGKGGGEKMFLNSTISEEKIHGL